MKPLLIIKTGSSYPQIVDHYGDFEHWIAEGLRPKVPVQVVDARLDTPFPVPLSLAGVVITGSHAMVTEQLPWMMRLARWLQALLQQAASIPVLGICFGHQLLARCLGGEVADNPMGMEVGTVPLHLNRHGLVDPLLSGLRKHPWVQVVHRQSVLRSPPGVQVLASNVHDACQAFRYGDRVWGVQFHPEFTADRMRAYLQACRGHTVSEQAAEQALLQVRECDDANGLLAGFAELAGRKEGF